MPRITTRSLLPLLTLIALSGCAAEPSSSAGAPGDERTSQNVTPATKLVFSIDQGWSDGLIELSDAAAIERVVQVLDAYKKSYAVYALVNPMVGRASKSKLVALLDRLVKDDIDFVFDAVSSDTFQMTATAPMLDFAADPAHGMAMAPTSPTNADDPFYLDFYVRRYGKHFAGLRFFETGSMSLVVRACRYLGDCKLLGPNDSKLPADDFFEPNTALVLSEYARHHGMFVVWSDPIWGMQELLDRPGMWGRDFLNAVYDPSLNSILERRADTVYVVYANNDGHFMQHVSDWTTFVEGRKDEKGFGLSDQSWNAPAKYTSVDYPWEYFGWWIAASPSDISVIQFEPFWHLFQWARTDGLPPADMVDFVPDVIDSKGAGCPTAIGRRLAVWLGVTLGTISGC